MTGFIRPEARAALWRWREVLAGMGAVAIGLWCVLGPGQLLGIIGLVAILAGLSLVWVGTQRARFRGRAGGPGSVVVDEGQVTYFGPLTGGAVAVAEISELALLRSSVTEHWRLTAQDQTLFIPTNAEGADALFDAFATLPGLKMERVLAAQASRESHDVVIWQARAVQRRTLPLH